MVGVLSQIAMNWADLQSRKLFFRSSQTRCLRSRCVNAMLVPGPPPTPRHSGFSWLQSLSLSSRHFSLCVTLSLNSRPSSSRMISSYVPFLIISARMLHPSGINRFWRSGQGHIFLEVFNPPQFHPASSKTLG